MLTEKGEEYLARDVLRLDPDDPFESVLIPIIETNRKKRRDYASDDDIFSNFAGTARFAGFEADWLSALFNCSQKLERMSALRLNGRLNDPANEAVADTLLDNAVYGIIALAIYARDQRREENRLATAVEKKSSRSYADG